MTLSEGHMTQDIYKLVARRIREERTRAGLSMVQLAEAAGIGPSFLGYIETEDRKPSLQTITKLANALKIPVADLFRGVAVKSGGSDYRLIQQFTHMIRTKTSAQKATIMNTLRALAKSLR